MSDNLPKKFTFHVQGMHCKSCVVLTESELKDHPKVSSATSSLETMSVDVEGNFGEMPPAAVATELTAILAPHGYTLLTEAPKTTVQWKEFYVAVPAALGFIFLFFLLQKLGILNLVHTSNVTYGTAFVVGVIASLSTCMAVVGGLVLSMSATFAKKGDMVRPQVLFHAGRIVSFFVLGGVIGIVGAAFQLGPVGTLVLSIIIGLVMVLLGLNLLDIFQFTKWLQPTMPKFLSSRALNVSKINSTFTPALVGTATFFLPCGFTQSMQFYTLTTGNFLSGGLTMLSFALGTLPVLALVSFSSFSVKKSSKAGVFFKAAGIIVILFALFNILNSLAAIGWIDPVLNF